MEIGNNVNRQSSTNFGMALIIKKEAAPFIESLSSKERSYLREVGNRIKHSRNHIVIGEGGKLYSRYTPNLSEMRIVSPETSAAIEADAKLHEKRLKSVLTMEEKNIF